MTPRSPAMRHRRALGAWVMRTPQTLRALVRVDEVWLAMLAAVIGALAGLCVAAMNVTAQAMHRVLFSLPPGVGLSAADRVPPLRALLVPTCGGLVLGLSGLALAHWYPRRAVDPVEANALFGGRMSLGESAVVTGQTLVSNGAGGSVGLEAGYAQIGAAFASRIGQAFRLRRNDLRVMVGCGAGAAIAGAFNAPLAGAFYGIELIIGTYSISILLPVVLASLAGVFVVRALTGGTPPFDVYLPPIRGVEYLPMLVLGVVAALIGVAIMRSVTLVEAAFRRSRIPVWLRPVSGGLIVGCLALVTPRVLSSGHSALHADIGLATPPEVLLLTLVLKSCASAVSIGTGFRGGLFFASLFLGSLVGKLFAVGFTVALHGFASSMHEFAATVHGIVIPEVMFAVVGMSALAVAVVGGPLTMTFLALESTHNFSITAAVLGAAILSALTVRRTFGYSFTTWRFHLRGEAIRSAVDIGWIQSLQVGKMMRRGIRTIRPEMPLEQFRQEFPLGSTQRVVVVGETDRYAGIVYPAEAHAAEQTAERIAEILHHQEHVLEPHMSVKEAIAAFESAESDALAVVDGGETRRVIGLLSEQYALRRYAEELDRRRRELSGE